MAMDPSVVESLAIAGVTFGCLSFLVVIALIMMMMATKSKLRKLEDVMSAGFESDGTIKKTALPSALFQDVGEMIVRIEALDTAARGCADQTERDKILLQDLWDKLHKLESDNTARQVKEKLELLAHGTSPQTTSAAQPLRVADQASKPAVGPSPVSPASSNSSDDPPSERDEMATPQKVADSISYVARRGGETDPAEDVMVKADIGFGESSTAYQPAGLDHQHHSLWSPPHAPKNNFRIVPLLPIQQVQKLDSSPKPIYAASRTISKPAEHGTPIHGAPTPAQLNRSLEKVSPGGASNPSSTPGNTSSRSKRHTFSNHSGPPLSARGINPDKHPELHAKELAEMQRLVQTHCHDSAAVVSRTAVRCLWCHENFICPPYRPQSFFFKDLQNNGEHDGHYWTCLHNPNNSLQMGRGVNVGDGKVLI
mmetsp:Transcript_37282/g.76412  ORF Transcript_37282/g.76412 Transcript_37282/m.76412 type:complete len:425 (-) Transcript_37282:272-1546(-)